MNYQAENFYNIWKEGQEVIQYTFDRISETTSLVQYKAFNELFPFDEKEIIGKNNVYTEEH